MGTTTKHAARVLLTLASVAATSTVALTAAPAQAGWTNASGITQYRICRAPSESGRGWVFVSRVRKRADTADARAGVMIRDDGQRRQQWRSGWLDDGEAERGTVRIRRSRGVRLHIWQEAGDRSSPVGTALETAVYRPRELRHCDNWR